MSIDVVPAVAEVSQSVFSPVLSSVWLKVWPVQCSPLHGGVWFWFDV